MGSWEIDCPQIYEKIKKYSDLQQTEDSDLPLTTKFYVISNKKKELKDRAIKIHETILDAQERFDTNSEGFQIYADLQKRSMVILSNGLLFAGFSDQPCNSSAFKRIMNNPTFYARRFENEIEQDNEKVYVHIKEDIQTPPVDEGKVLHYATSMNPFEYLKRMVFHKFGSPDEYSITLNVAYGGSTSVDK